MPDIEWNHDYWSGWLIKLKLESWSAIAPGIDDVESWRSWLVKQEAPLLVESAHPSLKEIPPLLRRRFTTLGKYAARAVLNQKTGDKRLATVFASRHGDTSLTLSLLEEIGRNEALSPTAFSLAVHNAVGGLLSIAGKDQSPMTAIASKQNLVLSTFHEAIAQLQTHERVLCVIYDVPLPEIYRAYSDSLPFPVAIAFVLGKQASQGSLLALEQKHGEIKDVSSEQSMMELISLLTGLKQQISLTMRGSHWLLSGDTNA